MDHYARRRSDLGLTGPPVAKTGTPAKDATRLLRRLLPFPSSEGAALLQSPLTEKTRTFTSENPLAKGPADAVQQAAPIVAEAAAILDEEMARGVLAARDAGPSARRRDADQGATLLGQVHDVIDNIARIWPTLPDFASHWPAGPPASGAVGDDEALASLMPASALRPGQRGTISMTLCNDEDRPVRLMPASTDLISSTGGRLSSQLFEFVPREVHLEPGERREIQGQLTIPGDSVAGCYVGLWVVTGVSYVRALITIEVR